MPHLFREEPVFKLMTEVGIELGPNVGDTRLTTICDELLGEARKSSL